MSLGWFFGVPLEYVSPALPQQRPNFLGSDSQTLQALHALVPDRRLKGIDFSQQCQVKKTKLIV
jgi:hypothetical protein